MKLESAHVYRHDDYDEVLVLGIHRRYDTYETDEQTGVEDGVYVRYTEEWDGYGAMPAAIKVDPVEVFTAAVGSKLRRFDRISAGSDN